MSDDANELSLREQKKAEIRANVLDIAQRLFHDQGFDATTLEEICSEAMISKRTFFRYFQDKESLVFPNREERLEMFVAFLEANQNTENPFDTLRDATRFFASDYHEKADKLVQQQKLIMSSPTLVAREREIDRDWEREIAKAFAKRSNDPQAPLWSAVTAGAVMGVVRATVNYWCANEGRDDLGELGLIAIECLERGFPERVL